MNLKACRMRRSKGYRPNKFMRFIRFPFKALGKARDLYVRCLTSCASRVSYGQNYGDITGLGLPRSFSGSSATFNGHEDDLRELIRAASVRSLVDGNEMEMFTKQQFKLKKTGSKVLPKSCSVGGMGRIDEDKPCEFEEINAAAAAAVVVDKNKQDFFYPRSQSYAVTKKRAFFF